MERNYPYKDAPPEETIRTIKKILKKAGIRTEEKKNINNAGVLYSLRLYIKDFPYKATGKGLTESYALAGAYAELLERLQNQILWPCDDFRPLARRRYGFRVDPHEKIHGRSPLPSLPEDFKKARIFSKEENLYTLWKAFRKILDSHTVSIVLLPYYNLRDQKVDHLPQQFIFNIFGSNGMAAGNTPEEAIVQGISEIFERYAMKQVYFERITPPTVPQSYIKKHAPEQYALIKKLEKAGSLRIIVKDCSLGKKLPVVGTLIIFPSVHSYVVSFGASPIWQIALERCLTEAFQMDKIEDYKGATPMQGPSDFDPKKNVENFVRIYKRGKGYYPPSLFAVKADYEFKRFPEKAFGTQKDMMHDLLHLVKELQFNVYLRDVSFLKFPAFQILIPGLSELKVLSDNNWREAMTWIPWKRFLKQLPHLSAKELSALAADMEDFLSEGSQKPDINFSDYTGLPVNNLTWQSIPLRLVLALIWHKSGELDKACHDLRKSILYLQRSSSIENLNIFYAALDFWLLGKDCRQSTEISKAVLRNFYDTDIVDRTVNAFRVSPNPLRTLRLFFPDFHLPRCWDCRRCPVSGSCDYTKLEKIYLGLKKAIRDNPIDQLSLSRIL
jgi:ribosomal protein S12 methylthiotransferase accessory factor